MGKHITLSINEDHVHVTLEAGDLPTFTAIGEELEMANDKRVLNAGDVVTVLSIEDVEC